MRFIYLSLPYTQATANTQIVGVEMAKLIKSLCQNTMTSPADFHLIGHSLGAHISGYAGQLVPGLGRITGLDPAGPYFENTDPVVRLDPTDAQFVEAIHTDGTSTIQLGLGLLQVVGHVDYYPNGGYNQPNCPATSSKLLNTLFSLAALCVECVENGISCSHSSSFDFFTDSIENKCKYTAYPCSSKADFDKGLCLKCSDKGCNRMGYWSSKSNDNGMLFLNTQSPTKQPFCKQHYRVELYSNNLNGAMQTRGKFTFYFLTRNHMSTIEVLDNSETTFKQDSVESRFISLNEPIYDGDILSLFVSFEKSSSLLSSWLYWNEWSFKYVEVFSGDNQSLIRFCPYKQIIQSGQTVQFKKC